MQTPNTVLTTPFRTREGQVGLTPSQTPGGKGLATPTPLRDKLAINPDEGFDDADKFHQRELKATLKLGLSTLPQPKNDFEIVVPEDEDMNEVKMFYTHMFL